MESEAEKGESVIPAAVLEERRLLVMETEHPLSLFQTTSSA
jgi:hypothetical protein